MSVQPTHTTTGNLESVIEEKRTNGHNGHNGHAVQSFKADGLKFERHFTKEGVHPFDEILWEKRAAVIKSAEGQVVFEKLGVEIPKFWSQNATNIAASHYLYGEHEYSVKQWIDRIAGTIKEWGLADGYFASEGEAQVFYDELAHLMVNQYLAFNSPVNYNCGVWRYDQSGSGGRYHWDKASQSVRETTNDYEYPQCSACFILGIDDSMDSIMEAAKAEARIFKFGSGSGINVSKLRSSKEKIRGKGTSSGPVTFMKGFDAFAGVIKSGGKTRRAAKMVVMDVTHPDIEEFIWCKVKEERKAHILIQAGLDPRLDGEVYNNIFYQNANNSVRVTDEFMKAAATSGKFATRFVTTGEVCEEKDAKDLLRQMAEAAWETGDPGLQYDGTIQNWHTSANTDRINATNPCSEYVFLDNTACNLASLNLMKFRFADGSFDTESFIKAVTVLITAQEILVDNAAYPTHEIARMTHIFRTLGIGYANLGALLMSMGIPYDSDQGRAIASAITAIMTGQSYKQSAFMARNVGPFPGYFENREPFQRVMRQHRDAAYKIDATQNIQADLLARAEQIWDDVVFLTEQYGGRNAQVSVLAPTGTISFIMDCDTTGVEPPIALVAYKKMVGGGYMKLVNDTVGMALKNLGYGERDAEEIMKYLQEKDTIEGAPGFKDEHLPVFDCAFKAMNGERFIHHMGHIKMMGAIQPFLSGAISKTVNMPEHSTVEDVMEAYIEGWKAGLKAIAIYRDGSKKSQPLNTKNESNSAKASLDESPVPRSPKGEAVYANGNGHVNGHATVSAPTVLNVADQIKSDLNGPQRRKLPDERLAITHKFEIAGHEGYLTVGLFPDGKPGELFINMNKEGSTLSGLMDAFSILVSFNLQYGVPLEFLVNKFAHMRFEPAGMTKNKQIPFAKSIVDYVFRYLAMKFLDRDQAAQVHSSGVDQNIQSANPLPMTEQPKLTAENVETVLAKPAITQKPLFTFQNQSDAPMCTFCGAITVRNGSCYKCLECGSTTGCS